MKKLIVCISAIFFIQFQLTAHACVESRTSGTVQKTYVIAALIGHEVQGKVTLNLIQGTQQASQQHTAVKAFLDDIAKRFPSREVIDLLVSAPSESALPINSVSCQQSI